MILACEICAMDERLRFRYATLDLFREHLELVQGILLDEDGRSLREPSSPTDHHPPTELSVILPKPRRP